MKSVNRIILSIAVFSVLSLSFLNIGPALGGCANDSQCLTGQKCCAGNCKPSGYEACDSSDDPAAATRCCLSGKCCGTGSCCLSTQRCCAAGGTSTCVSANKEDCTNNAGDIISCCLLGKCNTDNGSCCSSTERYCGASKTCVSQVLTKECPNKCCSENVECNDDNGECCSGGAPRYCSASKTCVNSNWTVECPDQGKCIPMDKICCNNTAGSCNAGQECCSNGDCRNPGKCLNAAPSPTPMPLPEDTTSGATPGGTAVPGTTPGGTTVPGTTLPSY